MWAEEVSRRRKPGGFHPQEQVFRRQLGSSKAQAHGLYGCEGPGLIEVDGVCNEVVSTSSEKCIPGENVLGKIPDVVRHDDGGLGLYGSGDDMQISWIGKIGNRDDIALRGDTSFRKGTLHGASCGPGFFGALPIALSGENFFNRCLSFVQDGSRPAKTEEVCLRKREDKISLQRSRQHAGVDKSGEAVGKHEVRSDPHQVRPSP